MIERLQRAAAARPTSLAAAAVFLALFVVVGVISARTHTPTVDEFVYLPAGYYYLKTGDFSHEPTNPALLKMAAALPLLAMDLQLDTAPRWRDNRTGWAPWTFGTRFMDQNRARYLDAFAAARLVILALGVAAGVLVWLEGRELLTPLGALAALLLYCTMPPIAGHASLATLDVGVTALLFATFVALARFAAVETWPWAATAGALLGLAFTAKGVTVLFVPLVPVLAALEWRTWDRDGIERFVWGFVVLGLAAWIAVLVVYGFSGFPLPPPVVEGIRFQLAASSAGEFPAFLNGNWSQTGWWYYYLVALVLKTPLPTLVLVAVGLAGMARQRFRRRGDVWMIAPVLLLLYFLSFHYGKNYGIRYLLPAFPFLVLVAGRGVDALLRTPRTALVVAGLLVWQAAGFVLATPHHLAYFNLLAGPTDHARRLLLDSNLDWGQDLGRLKQYLGERGIDGTKPVCLGYFGHVDPAVYGMTFTLPAEEPAPGLCAISANFLAGYPYAITYAGERMRGVRPGAWARYDRLQPVARVGRSIYVFDVTADDARAAASAR